MSEKWEPGRIIDGRYEIESVASGGMGSVFLCYDRSRERDVVLKTFKDRFMYDERVVRRFSDEAATWIRLGSHPNIVRAISLQNIDFRPYIVLERIRGDARRGLELTGHISDGGMEIGRVVDLAAQFCAGMVHACATSADFVHADIKPSNIFIDERGTLKITDFGLSRSYLDRERLADWGSLAYMPPERLAGAGLDSRSDVYSFGCVLYEMTVGRRPFRSAEPDGRPRERQKRGGMRRDAAPPRPSERRPDCPEALDELIMSCLEEDPARRIRDFEALGARLATEFPSHRSAGGQSPSGTADPAEHRMELERGIGFADVGRYREALACFDSVLNGGPDADSLYVALCGRAASLDRLGLADEAAAVFDSAIALLPDRPFARMMRANVDNDRGLLEEALAGYDEALAMDGDYPICHYNRGLCHERLGRLDEALADFGRAIELGFTEAYTNRGGAYRSLGRTEEALRDFEAAISLNPRNAIALANAGSAYADLGRPELAMASLERSIRIKPGYLLPYFFRAELLLGSGRFREAIEDFEKALSVDPALAALESGLKYTITEAELDRVYPVIYHDCALACLEVGEDAKARRYLGLFVERASPMYRDRLGPALRLIERLEGDSND